MEITTELKEYAIFASVAVPVLIGLLQIIKNVFPKTKRFIPLIGLVFGIGLSFLVNSALVLWLNAYLLVLFGFMVWLSPTGFYEAWKNLFIKKDPLLISKK